MSQTLLFVYGLLQPQFRPPSTMRRSWPDKMHGNLVHLVDYPAATRIEQSDAMFEGHVIELDESELADLDAFEGVDEGLYRRIRAKTLSGQEVWIYEYLRPLPANATLLTRWPS